MRRQFPKLWMAAALAALAVTLSAASAKGQENLVCPPKGSLNGFIVMPLLGGTAMRTTAPANARYTISWGGTGDRAELQERKPGGSFVTILRSQQDTSKSFVKLCAGCEGVWEYRLRYCIPAEPGFSGSCAPYGEVCSVTVDHPDNLVLSTAQVPECTEDQLTAWQVAREAQGVAARDPAGERIGAAVAYRRNPPHGLNWYPVDSFKQTLCGTVHDFDIHDGGGAEFDFNHFIIPNDTYAFILEDVKPSANPDDVYDCAGTDDCLEVEITPPEDFFANPWFDPNGPSSVLTGRDACLYGPWVWEEAHGNRPEIHPSELIWWSEPVSETNSIRYYLILLQDDSNRFDRNDNFNVADPPPVWWRPWSAYPRSGEFKIAFELNPYGSPLSFAIREVVPWRKNVVTARDENALEDADDGTQHAIEYNGMILLTAAEVQQTDDDIGVNFVDICRDAANTRLQGYMRITSKVGTSDRGGEGYHVIRVGPVDDPLDAVSDGEPSEEENGSDRGRMRRNLIENSLRRDTASVRPLLLADAELEIGSNAGLPAAELTVAQVVLVAGDGSRTRLGFSQDGPGQRIRVQGVPATPAETAHLEVMLQSGTRLRVSLPEIALAPSVTQRRTEQPTADASALRGMWQAAGARGVLAALPATPQRVKGWELEVTPGYAPIRMGTASREDDSPVVEQLNDVLRSGEAGQIARLFGSNSPFTVEWSFVARDLAMGARIPVKVDQPATATEVRVDRLSGGVPGGRIRIRLPEQPAHDIIELTATARMRDTFGIAGEVQHRVWSHTFAGETTGELMDVALSAVAAAAGITVADLREASNLEIRPDDARARDARSRRARTVHLLARRAAQDLQVDVGELQTLIRTAQLLEGP